MKTTAWPTLDGVRPYYQNDSVQLYHGEALDLVRRLPKKSIDGFLTDPPYCSGAGTVAGRGQDVVAKYAHHADARGRPSFDGDAREPRGFEFWLTLLMGQAFQACRPGAYVLSFIDWRMLPSMINIVQASGFGWKGIATWNKGRGSRAPHKGYFRHQCEYIVWGSKGSVHKATHDGPYDGCYTFPVKQTDKYHLTGKPTDLMVELMRPFQPGSLILDTFGGSGTTGVAAMRTGRRVIMFEQEESYCEISAKRFDAEISTSLDLAA